MKPHPAAAWLLTAAIVHLTLLLVACGSAERTDAATARSSASAGARDSARSPDEDIPRWIWSGAEARDGERLVFRREFVFTGPARRATLIATCDNTLRVLLDGEPCLDSDSWEVPVAAELTASFAHPTPRRHVLEVYAANREGPAGLLLQLQIERAGSEAFSLVSDARWHVADDGGGSSAGGDTGPATGAAADQEPAMGEDEARDVLVWRPAVEVAQLGDLPWTLVSPQLLAATPRRRTPGATPVENLRVAPGFAVDLLLTPTAGQGSWVSLCVDPAGRLIVSDQRDAGLYRITLPAGAAAGSAESSTAAGSAGAAIAAGAAAAAPAGAAPAAAAPAADAATDASETPRIERLDVPLSGAQGLAWADDSLYAVVGSHGDESGGLYRLRDSDGDDRLDDLERLRELHGGGEHGWHAVLPTPDGQALYVVGGNATTLTELAASRVPRHWGEDQLLPRLPDSGGFMTDVLAPGGCVYRVSLDGQRWELLSIGYRNAYDLALDARGELFTFDSDMEWDLNTPWYRPTRLCLVASGSDYGWRNGSGKFPPWFADTLPPVLELGPGSPVGMCFGTDAAFPERWRSALFLGDWSYGRIHAVHLQPEGAGYRGEAELFLSGTPLPVTDFAVRPQDGALYLVTGGRDVQGGLYRVRWVGGEGDARGAVEAGAASGTPTSVALDTPEASGGSEPGQLPADAALTTRRTLEWFHAHPEQADLDVLWPPLGDDDRFIRHAARIALELQPVAHWSERALAERDPQTALTALVALARASGRDAPDAALRARLLAALEALPWDTLEPPRRLELLRALNLVFTRLGAPDETERQALVDRWSPRYPSGEPRLDGMLCTLLAFLQDESLAARAVPRLGSAPTQEEQLDIARCLRVLRAGWTPGLRRDYFAWFVRASGYRGGNSFAGFVRAVRTDALALVSETERAALLAEFGDETPAASPLVALQGALAGRQLVQQWTADALLPRLDALLADPAARDPARARQLFGAVGCFACHRVGGEGGSVGPDLTAAGRRFALPDLLAAILDPSATVSDQYQLSRIDTLDGESLTGHIVNLSGDSVDLSLDLFRPSELRTVDRGLIVGIRPSSVSAMPEGLLDVLEPEEIADLVAWLLASERG